MSQEKSTRRGTRRCDVQRCGISHAFAGMAIALLVLVLMISAASASNIDQTWYFTKDMATAAGGTSPYGPYYMYLSKDYPASPSCPTNDPLPQAGKYIYWVAFSYIGNGHFLADEWNFTINSHSSNTDNIYVDVGVWNSTTLNFTSYGSGNYYDPNGIPAKTPIPITASVGEFNVTGSDQFLCVRLSINETGSFGINHCECSVLNTYLTIGDRVWDDCTNFNYNGVQDAGEPGVPNVNVSIYYGGDIEGAVPDAWTFVNNTTTDENGSYLFEELVPGWYYLEFDYTNATGGPWGGWTLQDQGGNDTKDSDVNATGTTDPFYTLSGEINLTVDAGLIGCNSSIGDFVWDDCSGDLGYYDGIQQNDENGVQGVNVSVYNSTKSWVNTTTTNGTGYYNFINLTPGVYYLEFELPDGYSGWTLKDQGGDDTKDSDVNATGWTGPITLGCCEQNLTLDAGLLPAEPCPPIPEMGTVVLFSVGLFTLAGYAVVRRRR